MAASNGEDWDSFINRMCRLEKENTELLQKVQQLEAENAALKERLRWRDVSKELPPKEDEEKSVDVEIISLGGHIGYGFYSYERGDKGWYRWDVSGEAYNAFIAYWRPLDLPEIKDA